MSPDTTGGGRVSSESADVVVVGGGHNGLVCAAYLARAGLDVCVVEKNDRCGGALFSSERDGVTLEHGGIDHSTIVASTIPDDLQLEQHGLRYHHRTASAVHLYGDGVEIRIATTAEETAESIAAVDEADAAAWLELADLSTRLFELQAELATGSHLTTDTAARLGRRALGRRGAVIVELATMPAAELAERWFRSPHMRALAAFRSQFSGLPATHPGTGAVFCLTPAGHGRRYSRPEGGSAAFIASLESAIRDSGGRVRCDFPVARIHPENDGWLVQSDDGEAVHAGTVVSAIPPQVTLLELVQPWSLIPTRLRHRLAQIEVVTANLSQFTIAAALDGPPPLGPLTGSGYEGSQLWLLTEPAAFTATQRAIQAGQVAERPAVLTTFPIHTDPTSAPAGRASMWINGFIARELHGSGGWTDEAATEAADRIWRTVDACLPGVRDRVVDSVFTSPDELTDRTGARNPGFHLSATLPQLMGGRPVRGCADHRSGIDGIYLTGAGTNPGPGISGLPGRECARAVLDDRLGLGRARSVAGTTGRELARAWRLGRLAIATRRH